MSKIRWHKPIIPTLGGLRQKHCEFQSSLGYKSKIKSPKEKSYFTERLR